MEDGCVVIAEETFWGEAEGDCIIDRWERSSGESRGACSLGRVDICSICPDKNVVDCWWNNCSVGWRIRFWDDKENNRTVEW